jgi:hypothetical protein
MTSRKPPASPILFYTIVSTLTCLVFVTFAVMAFMLTGLLNREFYLFIAAFFLLKSIFVGFGFSRLAQQAGRGLLLRGLGMYHGRTISLLAGAAIGFQLAELGGCIVGALLFFLIGRWTGPIISAGIARQIERILPLPAEMEAEATAQSAEIKIFPPAYYYLLLPVLSVLIALIIRSNGIVMETAPDYLLVARLMVVALSVVSVISPWLLRWYLANQVQPKSNLAIDLMPLGLVLSNTPVLYGLFLYTSGASLLELIGLAGLSLVSAGVWFWNMRPGRLKQPVG